MVSVETVPFRKGRFGKGKSLVSVETVPFRKGRFGKGKSLVSVETVHRGKGVKVCGVHQDSTPRKEETFDVHQDIRYPSERGRPLMSTKTVPFQKTKALDDNQDSTL